MFISSQVDVDLEFLRFSVWTPRTFRIKKLFLIEGRRNWAAKPYVYLSTVVKGVELTDGVKFMFDRFEKSFIFVELIFSNEFVSQSGPKFFFLEHLANLITSFSFTKVWKAVLTLCECVNRLRSLNYVNLSNIINYSYYLWNLNLLGLWTVLYFPKDYSCSKLSIDFAGN